MSTLNWSRARIANSIGQDNFRSRKRLPELSHLPFQIAIDRLPEDVQMLWAGSDQLSQCACGKNGNSVALVDQMSCGPSSALNKANQPLSTAIVVVDRSENGQISSPWLEGPA